MPNGPDRLPPIVRLAIAGMLLALVGHLGLLLFGGAAALRAPEAIEYGEPFIVSAAYNAAAGGRLYAPVDDLPFLHNNYNPLVQTFVGPYLVSNGISYAPMRAVTLGSMILLILVAGWLVRRTTGSLAAAGIGALLPLTCGFMFPWMCVGRVDGFATACSALAFAWAVVHEDSPVKRRAWFLVLAWIAFAAKQSVVGGCGAALLLAFVRGRRAEAIGLGVLFTAGCAAIVGVANWVTDGQHWLHAVAYNASHDRGGWWPQTLSPVQALQAVGWPLLLLSICVLGRIRRRDAPWVCWLLVTLPLGFMLVRKSGAHVHYFLEAMTALSVLVACVGTRTVADVRAGFGWRGVTAAIVVATLATIPGIPWEAPRKWDAGAWFKFAQARGLHRLTDVSVDPVPADIRRRITESDFPPLLLAQTATIAIECGRTAIFDVADFVRLQKLGEWRSSDRLLVYVRERRFPVIAVQHFGDDAKAEAQFGVSAIDGLQEAIEAHYVQIPQPYVSRRAKTGAFWVPKD